MMSTKRFTIDSVFPTLVRVEMATAASSSAVRTYDADFKKNPGTLSLTPTTIAWNPKNAGQGDRQQQNLNRVLGKSILLIPC